MSEINDDVLHPGHHSIRLKGADYSGPGLYFVTICTFQRRPTLGEIRNACVDLSPLGQLVQSCWCELPGHFPTVGVLESVVMPNHFHGIIEIRCELRRSDAPPLQEAEYSTHLQPSSLSVIIRSLKSAVTHKAHRELGIIGTIWQRSYFDRILRPGDELADARAYILDNPKKWQWDKHNPDHVHV